LILQAASTKVVKA